MCQVLPVGEMKEHEFIDAGNQSETEVCSVENVPQQCTHSGSFGVQSAQKELVPKCAQVSFMRNGWPDQIIKTRLDRSSSPPLEKQHEAANIK